MHASGKLFPRSDRAPAIQPVSGGRLTRLINAEVGLEHCSQGRVRRISSAFYISEARELTVDATNG